MSSSLRLNSGFFTVILLFLILISLPLGAQEFWGKVKAPYTGSAQVVACAPNNYVFAGTWGNGVYISTNSGSAWTPVNNGLNNLYINIMKITSNGNIYVGTEGGGFYVSTNNGNSWDALNEGLTNLNVRAFSISPTGNWFLGTYGGGVFRSIDQGAHWSANNKGLYYMDISAFGFTTNSNHILAATWGGGIYRSVDNGDSWTRANVSNTAYIRKFLVNSVGDMIAASNGSGVLISVDNGLSWKENDTNKIDKNITDVIYNAQNQLIASTRAKGILWYDDQNYEDWLRTNVVYGGINSLAMNSTGTIFAAQPYEGILRSTDGGKKFFQIGFSANNGMRSVWANKKTGVIYASPNGSGAYRSSDNGKTWTAAGLDTFFVYCFAYDSTGNAYAGTRYGIYKTTNNGSSWTQVGPKDSIVYAIAITPSDVIYAGGYHFYKTTNGGANWSITNLGSQPETTYSLALDNSGNIYLGAMGSGVYKSQNNGQSWTNILSGQQTNVVESIKFNSRGEVYVGAYNGVFISTNKGVNWIKQNVLAQNPNVKSIDLNTSDWAFAGLDWGEGCYHSTNGADWDSTNASFTTSKINSITSNPDGYTFMGADILYRSIDSIKLLPPTLVSPSSGTIGIELNPTLTWNAAEKAELYELQVSTKDDFSYRIEFVVQAPLFRKIENTLDYNTKYYWRVRSKSNATVGPWSEVWTFSTTLKPPILIKPANNKRGVDQAYDFVWYKVDGAAEYTIEVSKDSKFSSIAFTKNKLADSTTKVPGLEPLTVYYWRVMAKSPTAMSVWSETWSFLTVVAPPSLRAPANHSMELPTAITFRWDTSATATAYNIQISKFADFNKTIFDGATEDKTSHGFTLLEYNTKYYWRVYARNDDGISQWSEAWEFTTGIAAPTLTSPENNSKENPVNVVFKWAELEGIDAFHLQVASDDQFKKIVFEDSTMQEFSKEVPDLGSFTKYYWRVRVKIGNRWGFWSVVWSFRTILKAPLQTSPENNLTNQPLELYLQWSKPNGAQRYHIQVDKTPEFFDPFINNENQTANQQGLVGLDYETKYYWRVKAINDETSSAWSGTWMFETKTSTSYVDEIQESLLRADIYPNPGSGMATVSLSLKINSELEINIVDIFGKTITQLYRGYHPAGEFWLRWDRSGLAEGVYYLRIEIGNKVVLKPVLIIH